MQAQIRSAYIMGRTEKLKLFLNQQDPARFNRMVVYYGYLNRDRMVKLKLARQALQNLTYLEDKQKKVISKLQQLAEQKQVEQAKLENVKKERTVLLTKLNEGQKARQQKLGLLKRRESELRKLIQSLQTDHLDDSFSTTSDKPFALQKGKLIWPVQGKLSRKFASSGVVSKRGGVLIEAREGSAVHSIANGRVVYADWLKGYGLLIIIDHGKGYMTLYAFNQSLYKEVDEQVKQGDVIATVGKSGGRDSAGLYFAIRKKGKPLNPVRWCRKIRKGKVG